MVATTHLVPDDDQRDAAHGLFACDAASLLKRCQCRSSQLDGHIDVWDLGEVRTANHRRCRSMAAFVASCRVSGRAGERLLERDVCRVDGPAAT